MGARLNRGVRLSKVNVISSAGEGRAKFYANFGEVWQDVTRKGLTMITVEEREIVSIIPDIISGI